MLWYKAKTLFLSSAETEQCVFGEFVSRIDQLLFEKLAAPDNKLWVLIQAGCSTKAAASARQLAPRIGVLQQFLGVFFDQRAVLQQLGVGPAKTILDVLPQLIGLEAIVCLRTSSALRPLLSTHVDAQWTALPTRVGPEELPVLEWLSRNKHCSEHTLNLLESLMCASIETGEFCVSDWQGRTSTLTRSQYHNETRRQPPGYCLEQIDDHDMVHCLEQLVHYSKKYKCHD